MADSTITLRVVGDTSRAGGAPANAPQAPGKGPANAPQAPGAASDAGAAAPGLAPAHSGADPANGGKSIAGQIGAFAAGWGGQQVLGAVTGMINAIPGRQREASWVGNVGGGLLGGASAGAALGSVIPGLGTAVGAGIGAAVGAATGAINAWTEAVNASREAVEGIQKTLQAMTYDERLEAIAARARQIRDGDGDASIKSLERWLKDAAERGDTETEDYRTRMGLLTTQTQRLGALDALYDRTEETPPVSLMRAAETTDALAKRGGTVGPTVDVGDVNRDLLATLRDFFQAWKTRAGNRPDTIQGIQGASGFAGAAILG